MDKIEFIQRLEDVKRRLPRAAVPLYLSAFPKASKSRVSNTLSGKIQDDKILENLEAIADKIESVKPSE